jgi:hypothetical protein
MAKLTSKKISEVRIADIESHWLETSPGERTHYRDLDDGLPVVFLHGRCVAEPAIGPVAGSCPAMLTPLRSARIRV